MNRNRSTLFLSFFLFLCCCVVVAVFVLSLFFTRFSLLRSCFLCTQIICDNITSVGFKKSPLLLPLLFLSPIHKQRWKSKRISRESIKYINIHSEQAYSCSSKHVSCRYCQRTREISHFSICSHLDPEHCVGLAFDILYFVLHMCVCVCDCSFHRINAKFPLSSISISPIWLICSSYSDW